MEFIRLKKGEIKEFRESFDFHPFEIERIEIWKKMFNGQTHELRVWWGQNHDKLQIFAVFFGKLDEEKISTYQTKRAKAILNIVYDFAKFWLSRISDDFQLNLINAKNYLRDIKEKNWDLNKAKKAVHWVIKCIYRLRYILRSVYSEKVKVEAV